MARFGPFELVRPIASGGMAEIYLARTVGVAGFEKYFALKMIHRNYAAHEQFVQMLIDEANICTQLAHRNIVQTFDLGKVDDNYYITMEYVDGLDLFQLVKRASDSGIALPFEACAFVAREIAFGLAYAHRKTDGNGKPLGIVHRDVSPPNVLVSYAGEVKLIDFGIAKAVTKAWHTAIGATPGKYYYMSPEQASGAVVDPRSDIFSAGIVLYEMLTGEMLYFDDDLLAVAAIARKANIAPPTQVRSDIPPELERIVMCALAKRPEDRYQTADELGEELDRFLVANPPGFAQKSLAALVAKIAGDPVPVPTTDPAPRRTTSTRQLAVQDLVHDAAELHDENSVLIAIPSTPLPVMSSRRDFNEPTRVMFDRDTDRTEKFGEDTDTVAETAVTQPRAVQRPPIDDGTGDRMVMARPLTPVSAIFEAEKTPVRPSATRMRTLPGTGTAREHKRPRVPALGDRPWYQNQGHAHDPVLPQDDFAVRQRLTWRHVVLAAVVAICLGFLVAYQLG